MKTLNHLLQESGASDATIAGNAGADFTGETIEDVQSTEMTRVEDRGLKLNREHKAPDTYENALCAVTSANLKPAFDELSQTVTFRESPLQWEETYGRVLNDHVLRLVRVFLLNRFQGVAYQPGKDNLFEALMTVAYANSFNPVLDYLNSLKWDGTSRVTRLFPVYFSCADDAYTRAVSRCFMIGAVRRMRRLGANLTRRP